MLTAFALFCFLSSFEIQKKKEKYLKQTATPERQQKTMLPVAISTKRKTASFSLALISGGHVSKAAKGENPVFHVRYQVIRTIEIDSESLSVSRAGISDEKDHST